MLRISGIIALLLSLCFAPSASFAAEYPSKPIHIIVPWDAGGGTDVVARALAEAMKNVTTVPIIVDNVVGAGGSTGNKKVAEAEPDGYTVLLNGDTDILGSLSVMKTGYTLDSFKYIGGVFYSPTWILSHKDSGITTFADFLERARKEPNKYILGSTTPSGAQMVMCVMLQDASKAPFRIIPYQGGKDITKALLGNQVHAGVIHAPVMLAEVKAGIMNVIATGGSLAKSSYEPLRSMKTLKEQGIPVSMGINRGLFVPAGTPDTVVAALTAIVQKAVASPEFQAFGERFGFAPQWTDGASYKKNMQKELKIFEQVRDKSM